MNNSSKMLFSPALRVPIFAYFIQVCQKLALKDLKKIPILSEYSRAQVKFLGFLDFYKIVKIALCF